MLVADELYKEIMTGNFHLMSYTLDLPISASSPMIEVIEFLWFMGMGIIHLNS